MRTHWSVGMLVVAFVLGALCAAIAAEAPPAVEVHGWSLTRYYVDLVVDDTRDSSGVITNKEEDSRLEWERFSISGIARLAEGKVVYGEVYIHPWLPNDDPSFLYLESLYLDVPVAPGSKVRLGKGRSNAFGIVPGYGNRKTSNYGPLAETFTMDRALGVQFIQTRGKDSFNVGLFESQRPGTRSIGMAADMQLDEGSLSRTAVSHLTSRDTPASRSGQLELSARYGRQMGALNVGVSGRGGQLDETDSSFLASKFADYNGTNRTRLYSGVDATYQRMPWYAAAEWYGGSLGGIDQSGYAILLGVEPSAKCTGIWREISGACKGLFVRYTNLDIDTTPALASSITWDTEQWAVSYVLPVRIKYLPLAKWIQLEYEMNKETVPAGGDDIPNNVFFLELFSAF